MKKLIVLTAAAVTAFAGVASAQGYKTGDFARAALEKIAPNADVSALSNAEAVAVFQAVQSENSAGNRAARAESMINKCKVGFMERPERIVLVMIGAFTNRMGAVLWIILVLSVITVIDRIYFTWAALKAEETGAVR